jgi:hypothetical protein
VGEVAQAHRGAGDRQLVEHSPLPMGEQPKQLAEQDVRAAQQQGIPTPRHRPPIPASTWTEPGPFDGGPGRDVLRAQLGWTVTRDHNGGHTWTTPTGRAYTKPPEPIAEPNPPKPKPPPTPTDPEHDPPPF